MRAAAYLLLVAVSVATAAAGLFAWGQRVGQADARLFEAQDQARVQMIARACGTRGSLWQSPQTGQYACLYRNRSGEVLMHPVPDAPYLDDVQQAARQRLARG